jgi:hypothetical protein
MPVFLNYKMVINYGGIMKIKNILLFGALLLGSEGCFGGKLLAKEVSYIAGINPDAVNSIATGIELFGRCFEEGEFLIASNIVKSISENLDRLGGGGIYLRRMSVPAVSSNFIEGLKFLLRTDIPSVEVRCNMASKMIKKSLAEINYNTSDARQYRSVAFDPTGLDEVKNHLDRLAYVLKLEGSDKEVSEKILYQGFGLTGTTKKAIDSFSEWFNFVVLQGKKLEFQVFVIPGPYYK